MRKFLRFLASRNLAIVLLGLTIFVSLVGTSFFDQEQSGIYAKSWWFMATILFLLLSTSVCTLQRIFSFFRRETVILNVDTFSPEGSSLRTKASFVSSIKKLDHTLTSLGYKTNYLNLSLETIQFNGIKGCLGFWGSILFHLSFLIIGLGVIYNLAFKFSGDFVLVEGNTFVDNFEDYQHRESGLLSRAKHSEFEIVLEKFTPVVSQNERFKLDGIFSEDYVSSVTLRDKYENNVAKDLGINQVLKYKGYSIVPDYYGHGFAPKIVIKKLPQKGSQKDDVELETLIESYVALNTELHGSYDEIAKVWSKVTYRDVVDLEQLDLRLELNFFPQRPKEKEVVVESSAIATNPFLTLRAFSSEAKTPFFEGVVNLKEPIKLGAYQLEVDNVKNWQRFLVKKNSGQAIVYLGFFLGLLGLVIRSLVFERRLFGLVQRQGDETLIFIKEGLEKQSLQKSQLDKVLKLLGGQPDDRLRRKPFMDNDRSLFE